MTAIEENDDADKTVWICWGEDDVQPPKQYTFNTVAEFEAFQIGVAEADGWLGSEEFATEKEGNDWYQLYKAWQQEQPGLFTLKEVW